MKTKITLQHGHEVLRIDDTDYDEFPEEGDVYEHNDEVYRVVGVESALIQLEAIPEDEVNEAHAEWEAQQAKAAESQPDGIDRGAARSLADSKARTKARLAAESKARVATRRTARVQARATRTAARGKVASQRK